MKRRFISLILTLSMVVGFFPGFAQSTVFAEDPPTLDKVLTEGKYDLNEDGIWDDKVYEISTADLFNQFVEHVNANQNNRSANAVLTQSIELNDNVYTGFIINTYSGIFDGQGHTISGYSISGSRQAAFVGTLLGELKNLTLGGKVTETPVAAGFAWVNQGGIIRNCINIGEVSATGEPGYASGICFNNTNNPNNQENYGKIVNCINTGKITAPDSEKSAASGICRTNNKNEEDEEKYAETVNCINIGELSGCNKYGISREGQVSKSYYLNGDGVQGIDGAEEEVKGVDSFEDGIPCKETGAHNIPGNADKDGNCLVCGNSLIPELVDGYYQISNKYEFEWFAEYVNDISNYSNRNANAVLTNDIDLGYTAENPYEGEYIIEEYNGSFNGQGHTISGLYIKNDEGNASFIGILYSGQVKNLTLNGAMEGTSFVSGFVHDNRGTIKSCINNCTLKGKTVNGICETNSGKLENCINKGKLEPDTKSSVINGICNSNDGVINTCVNLGDLYAYYDAAANRYVSTSPRYGICKTNYGTIQNCINKGMFAGSDNGGKYGISNYPVTNAGTITDSCYLLQVDGIIKADGATALTAEQFQNGDACTLTKVHNINGIADEDGNCLVCGKEVAPQVNADGYYEIYTKTQLEWFVKHVNATSEDNTASKAKLMDDISMGGNEDNQWTIINSYSGTFDGNGHKIEGLYIDVSGSGTKACFVDTLESNATIKDLTLSGNFKAYEASGFVNTNKQGRIENCTNSINFSAYEGAASGICYDNSGTIEKCTNNGNITVPESTTSLALGGICIFNDGTINYCTNTGEINATEADVAGICNRNYGTIYGCVNKGSVSAQLTQASGISQLNDGTIDNCINIGAVSADVRHNVASGICYRTSGNLVRNCINKGTLSGSYKYGISQFSSENCILYHIFCCL